VGLRRCNLSLPITDEFLQAVIVERDWPLVFPLTEADLEVERLDAADSKLVTWRDWSQFSSRWRHAKLSQQ